MRMVVTGAGGGLGQAFVASLPGHHDVDAFAHDGLDIGDTDAVQALVPALKPDVIVNCAAYTKVDACETDAAGAFRANAIGVQNLAIAARASGAMFLHVSTDYVFDGDKGTAYDELDAPDPRSIYARSKLAGERFAQWLPEHLLVRTGFVYGGGTDFLTGAVARLEAGEEVGGLSDRIGSPTFVSDLADRLLALILSERFGTYHLAGAEATTWFRVLGRVKEITRFPGTVVEQTAAELDLPAPRPRDSSLVSVFSDAAGVPPMPPLDDALGRFLDAR